MTDAVFFFKASAPKDLPPGIKGIVLDPPESCMCSGTDPRCSSAYSCLWQSLRDSSGRVTPNLRKKYGVDGKIAFAPFSAGHGFVNPLLNNAADRADTSAVLLFDATFGGGKDGYVKAAKDAVAGKLLLVTTTSNTGGDNDWRNYVLKPAGLLSMSSVAARAPMPQPSGGVFQLGNLWYYRFVDSKGGTELPHWEMGKLLSPLIKAHLVPYFAGETVGSRAFPWAWVLGAVAVASWAVAWKRRK